MIGNLKANSERATAPRESLQHEVPGSIKGIRKAVLQRETCMNSKTLVGGAQKRKSALREFPRDFQNGKTSHHQIACERSLNLELVVKDELLHQVQVPVLLHAPCFPQFPTC